MRLSAVNLLIRLALRTQPTLDMLDEPERQSTLLFPGPLTHGTIQAPFGLFAVLIGCRLLLFHGPAFLVLTGKSWRSLHRSSYNTSEFNALGLRQVKPPRSHTYAGGFNAINSSLVRGCLRPTSNQLLVSSQKLGATFGVRSAWDKPKLAFSALWAASRIGQIRHPHDRSRVLMLAYSGFNGTIINFFRVAPPILQDASCG